MMIAAAVLKCVLLAKFHVDIVNVPITEYETAAMSTVHNGVLFEAQVMEGKINAVSIEDQTLGVRTMSYSSNSDEQRAMSLNLDIKNEHASMDCDIIK